MLDTPRWRGEVRKSRCGGRLRNPGESYWNADTLAGARTIQALRQGGSIFLNVPCSHKDFFQGHGESGFSWVVLQVREQRSCKAFTTITEVHEEPRNFYEKFLIKANWAADSFNDTGLRSLQAVTLLMTIKKYEILITAQTSTDTWSKTSQGKIGQGALWWQGASWTTLNDYPEKKVSSQRGH